MDGGDEYVERFWCGCLGECLVVVVDYGFGCDFWCLVVGCVRLGCGFGFVYVFGIIDIIVRYCFCG